MFPQPQNRRQYLQFGLVLLLCFICLVPTPVFVKSRKWRFPSWTTTTPTTTINNTAECRFFSEALFQFTNALHDRPESSALRPWTLADAGPKYPTWHFPGLSASLLQRVLKGKRVVLVGDSTLFGMMRWIQTLLNNVTAVQLDELGRMDLTPANNAIHPNAWDDQVGWADETLAEFQGREGTLIVWDGHRGEDLAEVDCQLDAIWARVKHLRPHIWVVNFGLHWLHLMGGGRDVPVCSVQAWLGYEQWLEKVVQVAEESQVRLLLLKTTNLICVENYRDDYQDTAALYERQDAYILSRCKREIQRLLEHHHGAVKLSDEDITRYCTKGVLDEHGSKDLNHRLLDFVQAKQKTSPIKMDIFNDHDVQSCEYSETDGLHYHPLNLMRIRLLANMIQCLYPSEE